MDKNKKLNFLFVCAVASRGGGGNIVMWESQQMKKMGVNVCIFNLYRNKKMVEETYPDLEVPIVYGFSLEDAVIMGRCFDVVCATHNDSVQFFHPLLEQSKPTRLGYYIQDFEPNFYDIETQKEEYEIALRSYTEIDNMVRFTKTRWNQKKILDECNKYCEIVGPSVNLDIFNYKDRIESTEEPLRICAMVRLHTTYRSPKLTMDVLQHIKDVYGSKVSITVFGSMNNEDNNEFFGKYRFDYNNRYLLTSEEVAELLNNSDIFLDYSKFQAMGLTAMEAMACGCVVVVPKNGGAIDYAKHMHNSIVVDTENKQECIDAVKTLIDDVDLLMRLKNNSMHDILTYSTENSAKKILELFGDVEPKYDDKEFERELQRCKDELIDKQFANLKKYKKIYIYGAGIVADRVSCALIDLKIDYCDYIVTRLDKNPDTLYGHQVISIEQYIEKEEDGDLVIVALGKKNQKEVIALLDEKRINYEIM